MLIAACAQRRARALIPICCCYTNILAFHNPYTPFLVEAAQVNTYHRCFVMTWAGSINCKYKYIYAEVVIF